MVKYQFLTSWEAFKVGSIEISHCEFENDIWIATPLYSSLTSDEFFAFFKPMIPMVQKGTISIMISPSFKG